MDHQETVVLLERARAGHAEAVGELYRRVAGRLLAYIRLRFGPRLRGRLDSRDILQATWLRAFEHLDEFRCADRGSLLAWLGRIAEREILDQADFHGREKRDARREIPISQAGGVAAEARSALSQVILNERAERLEQALRALDEPHREVILLRVFEELSFRDIGVRLERSEDASRMLFARAMTALTLRMTGHVA